MRRGVEDARGRRGVAIGAPTVRGANYEIIVDPKTSEFLGMRDIERKGATVRQVTAIVAHGVVDEIGERPPAAGSE